jgi:hypothetical protein
MVKKYGLACFGVPAHPGQSILNAYGKQLFEMTFILQNSIRKYSVFFLDVTIGKVSEVSDERILEEIAPNAWWQLQGNTEAPARDKNLTVDMASHCAKAALKTQLVFATKSRIS